LKEITVETEKRIVPQGIIVYKVFLVKNGRHYSLPVTGPTEEEFKTFERMVTNPWLDALGHGFYAFIELNQAIKMRRSKGSNHLVYRCLTTQFRPVTPERELSLVKNGRTFTEEDVIRHQEGGFQFPVGKGGVWCTDIYPTTYVL